VVAMPRAQKMDRLTAAAQNGRAAVVAVGKERKGSRLCEQCRTPRSEPHKISQNFV